MGEQSIEFEWDLPAPYIMDFIPGEDHIDGLNHVNNGVYVNWCQDVAWAHSCSLGLDMKVYHELDRSMVIRHAEYDYSAAAYLGETVTAATWLTYTDNKLNMERRFQLQRAVDGVVLVRAKWNIVCMQITTGRPKRMPEPFVRIYGDAVIDPGSVK